ncbi:inositol polyphosphate 5-phosphatase E isoform X4 [Daktulosphaira vitifoliae]|uniref:inositol polyphosphate 5-phosphatase E isoform X4 n=1 Tax=Daktulosphaira vitifoliae TaxID=58002 RepID=UPI0021AA635C|nr:inositol polyphosphate 5-phosphatase E isoform X4 [Daktulosphaira vitifoliae]
MDNLARQALFAAEVLHLIPTSDVKERSYLHGRIAGNSLLGAMELERVLHHREVRVYVGTWNMNGQAPPLELNEIFLPDTIPHLPDILAIGTQESYPDKFEWEVNIQKTIGPSHVLFHSTALGTLHLVIYIRRDLIWFCSDVTNNFDYVFWCGDLNFRLTNSRQDIMKWINVHTFPLDLPINQSFSDQLTECLLNDVIFRGFQEGPIKFAPTYKYDPGTKTFDSSIKQRTPSYTDRILYKCGKSPILSSTSGLHCKSSHIECITYCSVPSVCTSDHKPVWGLYKCVIRPGIDTMPLAAGLFNREVYLEAIKRRAASMNKRIGTSTVCTIQ